MSPHRRIVERVVLVEEFDHRVRERPALLQAEALADGAREHVPDDDLDGNDLHALAQVLVLAERLLEVRRDPGRGHLLHEERADARVDATLVGDLGLLGAIERRGRILEPHDDAIGVGGRENLFRLALVDELQAFGDGSAVRAHSGLRVGCGLSPTIPPWQHVWRSLSGRDSARGTDYVAVIRAHVGRDRTARGALPLPGEVDARRGARRRRVGLARHRGRPAFRVSSHGRTQLVSVAQRERARGPVAVHTDAARRHDGPAHARPYARRGRAPDLRRGARSGRRASLRRARRDAALEARHVRRSARLGDHVRLRFAEVSRLAGCAPGRPTVPSGTC